MTTLTIPTFNSPEDVEEYHETQLNRLKYLHDMKQVMGAKPDWSTAPETAKVLALNVINGDDFGKWCWSEIKKPGVGYVFVEPRPAEYVTL